MHYKIFHRSSIYLKKGISENGYSDYRYWGRRVSDCKKIIAL